jgi:hypothetical protein
MKACIEVDLAALLLPFLRLRCLRFLDRLANGDGFAHARRYYIRGSPAAGLVLADDEDDGLRKKSGRSGEAGLTRPRKELPCKNLPSRCASWLADLGPSFAPPAQADEGESQASQ